MNNLRIDFKIAIIILNYNSWSDTIDCIEALLKVYYSEYLIIVVDNGSVDNSVEKIKSWAIRNMKSDAAYTIKKNSLYFTEYEKEVAEKGGIPELENELQKYPSDKKIVLIKNKENLGYSAGNNVGIRYAIKKNADAVLIINPDVRIRDPHALATMVETLFSRDDIFIVGPNVIDAEGNRQSPLKEPSFLKSAFIHFSM